MRLNIPSSLAIYSILGGGLLLALGMTSCVKARAETAALPNFSTASPPVVFDTIFGNRANYRYIRVFGVHCVGSTKVSKTKFFHMASVIAQYLDNDEDGIPDDPLVLSRMTSSQRPAAMILFKNENEANSIINQYGQFLDKFRWQELFGFECHPNGSSSQQGFDATLEECLHLITDTGWAEAYPGVFGTSINTELCDAMDIARGGRFMNVPNNYPPGAWYHYDDRTCDYGCQATEYFYWLLTSVLGAQNYNGRCQDINNEWEPCSPSLVQSTDLAGWALMHDPRFNLPTVLPDGTYR